MLEYRLLRVSGSEHYFHANTLKGFPRRPFAISIRKPSTCSRVMRRGSWMPMPMRHAVNGLRRSLSV